MHVPDEKEKEEKKHRPVALQTLSSNSIPIPHAFNVGITANTIWDLRFSKHQNIKKRIFKLQMEACLISQGPTLIFTVPVYTKDGLSQKTSLQHFVLCDDLRLVSSLGLQSLKSYIILQAYYWPYIKDMVLSSQKYNKTLTHQWWRQAYEHTHRNTCQIFQFLWPQDGRKNKVLILREGSRDHWNVAELCLW